MKRLLLIFCMLLYHFSNAQEMWGIANSNFAGSAGMNLNPASMMLMPYTWEANIITANISVQNNYLAFSRTKSTTTAEGTPDPHGGLVDYYTSNDKSANAHVMLKLPSFIFRTCNNMAFGFHASVRTDLSVRNIPAQLAKFGYEGIVYTPLYGSSSNLAGVRMGELAWAEAGISAGKQLNKNADKKWLVAGTIKGIAAMQALSLNVESGSLNIMNDSIVTLTNFKGKMNTVLPGSPNQLLSIPGRGIGFDLGVCYVSNSNRQRFENGKSVPLKKYDYRIGVSLIDAGLVAFGGYTRTYNFNYQSTDFDTKGTGVDSMVNANGKKGSFIMAPPTALSVQYDRCLKPRIYLNMSVVQRVPLPMPHVDRPNQVSVSLRYESTFFEVAIPYSLYDYYLHRIGFAMRYHFIFMGTDKLGTFINNKEISGVDFYFGIRLTNFDFSKRTKARKPPCKTYF